MNGISRPDCIGLDEVDGDPPVTVQTVEKPKAFRPYGGILNSNGEEEPEDNE